MIYEISADCPGLKLQDFRNLGEAFISEFPGGATILATGMAVEKATKDKNLKDEDVSNLSAGILSEFPGGATFTAANKLFIKSLAEKKRLDWQDLQSLIQALSSEIPGGATATALMDIRNKSLCHSGTIPEVLWEDAKAILKGLLGPLPNSQKLAMMNIAMWHAQDPNGPGRR